MAMFAGALVVRRGQQALEARGADVAWMKLAVAARAALLLGAGVSATGYAVSDRDAPPAEALDPSR